MVDISGTLYGLKLSNCGSPKDKNQYASHHHFTLTILCSKSG